MSQRLDVIRQLLENRLEPLQLRILDESSHHAGHSGASPSGETHFRVEIVSQHFIGMPLVARHRAVFQAIGDLFSQGLHAVEITARTPDEAKNIKE